MIELNELNFFLREIIHLVLRSSVHQVVKQFSTQTPIRGEHKLN